MNHLKVNKQIRETVDSRLPGTRILLFGSRSRGDDISGSDYDLLIITPTQLTFTEKKYWSKTLDEALVKSLAIPVDLLLESEEEVHKKSMLPGHVVRTAIREGMQL
ncbi:MAG: nucleotidyltransferase domain-containing protein [Sphingobacteriales bacterium]|nr:MAG: nucleotidyltransferase domain-containing protein [Sphingobacteriales bacterium]